MMVKTQLIKGSLSRKSRSIPYSIRMSRPWHLRHLSPSSMERLISDIERAYPEGKKTEMLRRKVQTNHTKAQTMVSLIENDPTKYSTFTLAANALSEAISKALPALLYHKPRRSIGETRVSQSRTNRSRLECGPGQGNNLRGTSGGSHVRRSNQRSKNIVNDVDISNPTTSIRGCPKWSKT